MTRLSICIWSKHFATPASAELRFKLFKEQAGQIADSELVVSWMEDMPFKQHYTHWALNAAIRKAQGEYVLSTNRDIVFNALVLHWLSHAKFERNKIYRIDRTDLPSIEPYPSTLDSLREYTSKARVEAVNQIQHRKLTPLTFPHSVPHSNACGDFLLMHRDHWLKLRAFPELRGPSFHMDSFLLYNAIFSGIKQDILKPPFRIYHINHPRPEVTPIPSIMPLLHRMLVDHRPIILNSEDWGKF